MRSAKNDDASAIAEERSERPVYASTEAGVPLSCAALVRAENARGFWPQSQIV